ncbi:MAG: type II toxin-antitoxin system prevent-host-death family antitoxin [Elusimicrobia bacterium]|nr:type II toxin-antitoxin system prevent-host-death family antitoxin [Elusimicrobiota bacterium]
MQTFAAKKAKDSFGLLLDTVQHEPVSISKNNRLVAVVLSSRDYERFEAMENVILAVKAESAKKAGFIGSKASEKLLTDLLNA